MDGEATVIFQDEEFTLTVVEADPFWQWLIYRDNVEVVNGPALTESAARSAGLKVVTYLRGRA